MKELEVDTHRLIRAVLKKSWIIALIGLLCAGAVVLGSILLIPNTYCAEVLFCVDTGAENPTNITVSAARDLTDSCGVLLHSRSCLDAVSDMAGTAVGSTMLLGEAVNETEFFKVTVRADTPEKAEQIAKGAEKVLPDLAKAYLSGGTLKLVDSAGKAQKEQPEYVGLALCGFGLGILVSGAFVCSCAIKKEQEATA